MKAIGICWSFGRTSLCELLAMWQRQTVQIPLLVWLDVGHAGEGDPSPTHPPPLGTHKMMRMGDILIVRAERRTFGRSLAAMRRASIQWACAHYDLQARDAFLVVEDDDYYASTHVELTLRAMNAKRVHAAWTGSRRVGQQWQAGTPPVLCSASEGPGPHAQWALRVSAYFAVGGYPIEQEQDDICLAARLGEGLCTPHWSLTYVRREHGGNLCRNGYDIEAARAKAALAVTLRPEWSAELDALERWCQGGPWSPPSQAPSAKL